MLCRRYVYNDGTSTISVAGNFSLGNGGFLYNGESSTDAAILNVGGNLTVGVSGGNIAYVYNLGASSINVGGTFSLPAADSYLYNGESSTDTATFTIGNFFMGAGSYFVDYGTISVDGTFDPGSASPFSNDLVIGTFNALSGSNVTTDTATLEVQAGGDLNVDAGANFTVRSGGTLLADSGSLVEVEGSLTVSGNLDRRHGTGQHGGVEQAKQEKRRGSECRPGRPLWPLCRLERPGQRRWLPRWAAALDAVVGGV